MFFRKPILYRKKSFYMFFVAFFSIIILCAIITNMVFILTEKNSVNKNNSIHNRLSEKSVDSFISMFEEITKYSSQLQESTQEDLSVLASLDSRSIYNSPHLDSLISYFQESFLDFHKIPSNTPYIYFEKSNYILGTFSKENCLENDNFQELIDNNLENLYTLVHSEFIQITGFQHSNHADSQNLLILL